MMKKLLNELIIPAGLMSALVIGAGMFSLPHLFSLSGVLVGFAYLAVFAIYFSAIHLMYAEVVNATPGDHRFVGYARIHLGKIGFNLSFLTTVIGLIATLLIYITLSSSFIQILGPSLGVAQAAILFWVMSAIPVILGIGKVADLSLAITVMMIGAILLIFFYGVSGFTFQGFKAFSTGDLLLPYAAVLFSLAGRSAISSIKNYLKNKNLSLDYFNLSMVIGTVIPAILYALFVIGVLGLSGGSVTEDAISGLAGLSALPQSILLIVAILGIMSLWTSYIFLGLEFRGILISDFKFKEVLASIVVTVLPILFYLLGLNDFIALIGIAGGILLATESILVVLMWQKLEKRKPLFKIFSWTIVAVFLAGAFYEISKLL